MAKFVSLLLLSASLVPWAHADCPGSSLDQQSLRRLLDAQDVASLERAFREAHERNAAASAIYHQKRLSMNPTRAEEIRYLRSLPTTQAEVDQIYELTYTRDICEHQVVTQVVYGMYQTAARLVRRHGIEHRRFIRLCLFSNAEVGEVAWPEFDRLMVDDPDLTLKALRTLPEKTRRSICGGLDPVHLARREAVSHCHSEL